MKLSERVPTVGLMTELVDADFIRFTTRWFKYAGAREQAIRDQFAMTPTRYWQRVVQITADPARIAALPAELGPVVKRLVSEQRRQQEQRSPRAS